MRRDRFASDEEWYFSWYLDELREYGYISDYQHPGRTLDLSGQINKEYREILKTKTKRVQRELLKPHTYTCDFVIWWDKKVYKLLYTTLEIVDLRYKDVPFTANQEDPIIYSQDLANANTSLIDVKPDVSRRNAAKTSSLVTFPISQKWVMDKYGDYVQKIVVPKIFKETFTPGRYLRTDADRQDRILHYEPRNIDQYIIEQKARRDGIQGAGDQKSIF